ncbi:unnamed protein product [Orchesella dallaii]|uniref:A-kinase anchor protein 17A n=1 Tax=Orchesella dallaii TaxID=48710 RepID=A0ABP1QFS2_9HEXA
MHLLVNEVWCLINRIADSFFRTFKNYWDNWSILYSGKSMKITGFKEPMKIRVAEAKIPFPSKYDWDSFFRDAKNMNEMKPGERPDTIHLQNLPCKWFSDHPLDEKPIPSEKLFRRIWETFGDVRSIDIPIADPYRTQMQSSIAGIKTFTFSSDSVFEAYVQYRDYMNFVRAMDALRGCYIFFEETNKYWVANVKVDFDKSKHLGEESIRKRRIERERLIEKDKQEKMTATLSKLEEKEKSRKEIEEKKKETDKNQAKLDYKIALEERKYMIAQRKLEAIRLMDFLFERLKKKLKEPKQNKHKDKNSDRHEKIMGRYKELQEAKLEEQHKKLKKFHKSKKRDRTSSRHKSGNDSYEEDSELPNHESKDRARSRSWSPNRRLSRSRSRSRQRSRSRSKSRSRSRSHSRSRSRTRSESHSRPRSRSRSRSLSKGRNRSSSTRVRSRSRSRSQNHMRDDYRKSEFEKHGNNDRYNLPRNRNDTYYNDAGPDHGRDYHNREYDRSRGREQNYDSEQYHRGHNYDNSGRGRGFPHRGRPFNHGRGDGSFRPYRGRGRGSFPSRYLGDWELHDNPHGPGPMAEPNSSYRPPEEYFRGRGRGNFRGRGRGFQSHPQAYQNNRHESQQHRYYDGQTVHRDFTYLKELDRAYEKYFKSITSSSKNDNSHEEGRSPGP